MTTLLLATDADWVHEEVDAALADGDTTVYRVRRGEDVRPAVLAIEPDLVVVDLQIGNMGGMATCMDLRNEAGGGRAPDVPILMLLDRSADVFLARRTGCDGWLVKPLDSLRLRAAAAELLAGGTYTEAEEPITGTSGGLTATG